jgi:hypothetical protein
MTIKREKTKKQNEKQTPSLYIYFLFFLAIFLFKFLKKIFFLHLYIKNKIKTIIDF